MTRDRLRRGAYLEVVHASRVGDDPPGSRTLTQPFLAPAPIQQVAGQHVYSVTLTNAQLSQQSTVLVHCNTEAYRRGAAIPRCGNKIVPTVLANVHHQGSYNMANAAPPVDLN